MSVRRFPEHKYTCTHIALLRFGALARALGFVHVFGFGCDDRVCRELGWVGAEQTVFIYLLIHDRAPGKWASPSAVTRSHGPHD